MQTATEPKITVTGVLEWHLGVGKGSRFRVEFDGQPVGLADMEFRIISVLAMARKGYLRTGPLCDPTGWVSIKHPVMPGENTTRYIYRLKKLILQQAPTVDGWPVVITNYGGWYQIAADRDNIDIDLKTIAICPIPDIALLAKRRLNTIAS